jgi:hypothetical protein
MQMSHLSDKTKLDSFFKPTLLRSKTSTNCESSIDEHCLFIYFHQHYLYNFSIDLILPAALSKAFSL